MPFWLSAATMCVAAPDPWVVSMPRRIARLETMMSTEKLPGDEPDPCPTDDEDPADVPVANGSGGNGPPPPPPVDK